MLNTIYLNNLKSVQLHKNNFHFFGCTFKIEIISSVNIFNLYTLLNKSKFLL